ncbi:hypothetical protein [Gymnodinialimonas hymeniacidonis]|uniref:hypothetical protein n=1 Tax=Gymnodinialimonas hymeniacidonis TaxID=3126508 RepID=UPI0034C65231
MNEDVLVYAALAFIAIVTIMFALGLRRGRNVQATNEQIAANQQRQIELHERQVAALERIANSLENRG